MAPVFFEAISAIATVKEPQLSLDNKNIPSILKHDFSSRSDPCIFTLIAQKLFQWSNWESWVYLALKQMFKWHQRDSNPQPLSS